MRGKVCLITGANSGIGKTTALELAKQGAVVVMVCRSRERGEAAQSEIKRESGSQTVDLLLADLTSLQSIRQLAADFKAKYDRLDVLVNNAGRYNSKRELTVDGFESTFALNHLAYFLLTDLLLDVLKASAPSRIINLTSGAHMIGTIRFEDLQAEKRYSAMRVYGQSKLANVMFTYELARRLEGTGVTVNCVHPGAVRTGFGRDATGVYGLVVKLATPFMRSPEKGAETVLYLAASPDVEGVSGQYWVDKKTRRTSGKSYDRAVQERLWQVSKELTQITT